MKLWKMSFLVSTVRHLWIESVIVAITQGRKPSCKFDYCELYQRFTIAKQLTRACKMRCTGVIIIPKPEPQLNDVDEITECDIPVTSIKFNYFFRFAVCPVYVAAQFFFISLQPFPRFPIIWKRFFFSSLFMA